MQNYSKWSNYTEQGKKFQHKEQSNMLVPWPKADLCFPHDAWGEARLRCLHGSSEDSLPAPTAADACGWKAEGCSAKEFHFRVHPICGWGMLRNRDTLGPFIRPRTLGGKLISDLHNKWELRKNDWHRKKKWKTKCNTVCQKHASVMEEESI